MSYSLPLQGSSSELGLCCCATSTPDSQMAAEHTDKQRGDTTAGPESWCFLPESDSLALLIIETPRTIGAARLFPAKTICRCLSINNVMNSCYKTEQARSATNARTHTHTPTHTGMHAHSQIAPARFILTCNDGAFPDFVAALILTPDQLPLQADGGGSLSWRLGTVAQWSGAH